MKQPDADVDATPSQLIDRHIAELGDWRGEAIARLRKLIHKTDPGVTEEWKWNTPVFTHHGMVCAAGAFKDHVKLNFFKGASLNNPHGLLNAGLDAKTSRAIDFAEGNSLQEEALRELIREAIALNTATGKKR
jgi:hypothetical protein